jgi:hypothetical protein
MTLEVNMDLSAERIEEMLTPWFDPSYEQTPELAQYVATHALDAPTLSRGIYWYEEQKEDFEAACAAFMLSGWSVSQEISPFAAFSANEGVARKFAEQADYGLLLVVSGLKGVAVEGLVSESGIEGVDVAHEQEWLVPCGQHVEFDSMEELGEVRLLHGRVVNKKQEKA